MKIDLRQFDKQNMWLLPGGQMCVRPGYRFLSDYFDTFDGNAIVGGFSVINPSNGENTHYILANGTVSSEYVCCVDLYTGIGYSGTNQPDQTIYIPPVNPGVPITHADVDGQLVVAAPGMATLWGYTGGPVEVAEKKQTTNRTNIGSTVLEVPSGLCTQWADRCVIADGNTIYISDTLEPRTYGADNVLVLDGFCYGLFTSPNGALIMCTNKGVFQFSADAAASATVVGFLEKVSDFRTYNYKQTCLTKNGLWGITEKGFARIETSDQQEITIADKHWSRAFGYNFTLPDWRQVATIHPGQAGPIVSFHPHYMSDWDGDADTDGGMFMTDIARGFQSWWTTPRSNSRMIGNLVDILYDDFGREVYLMSVYTTGTGWVWRTWMPYGNIDKYDDTTNTGNVRGQLIGVIPAGIEESAKIDSIKVGSDSQQQMQICLNGEVVTVTRSDTPAGAIIGTTVWGDGTKYRAREISTRRAQYADRLSEPVVEIEQMGGEARVSNDMEVLARGYDKRRP